MDARHRWVTQWRIAVLVSACYLLLGGGRNVDGQDKGKRVTEAQVMLHKNVAKARAFERITSLSTLEIPMQVVRDEMTSHPAKYVRKTDSAQLLREVVTTQFKAYLEQELQRLAASTTDEGVVLEAQWPQRIMQEYQQEITATVAANLQRNFDPVFVQARAAAVQLQWQSVTSPLYPSPQQVERLAEQPAAAKQVQAEMAKHVQAQRLLFEENEARIQQAVQQILQDAQGQFAAQRTVLSNSTGGEKITASEIAQQLATELDQHISRLPRSEGRQIYPVFPSVQALIPERAQVLMQQKFATYLEQALPAALTETGIEQAARSSQPVPRQSAAHLESLVERFVGATWESVMGAYVERLSEPAAREAFRQTLTTMRREALQAPGLRAKVRARLEAPLRTARERLAEEELHAELPDVASGRWEVPETMLQKYRLDQTIPLAEFPRAKATGELMAETEKLLAARGTALLQEGRTALAEQRKLVDERRDWVLEEMKKRPGRRKEEWLKEYIDAVQTEWQVKRIARVWPDENLRRQRFLDKYKALFESVTKTWIPDIVTQAYVEAPPKEPPPIAEGPRPESTSRSRLPSRREDGTPDEDGVGLRSDGSRERQGRRHEGLDCAEPPVQVVGKLLKRAKKRGVPKGYEDLFQELRTLASPHPLPGRTAAGNERAQAAAPGALPAGGAPPEEARPAVAQRQHEEAQPITLEELKRLYPGFKQRFDANPQAALPEAAALLKRMKQGILGIPTGQEQVWQHFLQALEAAVERQRAAGTVAPKRRPAS